jgi:hypothetical protein
MSASYGLENGQSAAKVAGSRRPMGSIIRIKEINR